MEPAATAAAIILGAAIALAGVVWAEVHRERVAHRREIRDRRIADVRAFHAELAALAFGFRTALMLSWNLEGLDAPSNIDRDIGQHLASARFYAIHLRDDGLESALEDYRATSAALSINRMKDRSALLAMTADERNAAYFASDDDDRQSAAYARAEGRVRELLEIIDPLK